MLLGDADAITAINAEYTRINDDAIYRAEL